MLFHWEKVGGVREWFESDSPEYQHWNDQSIVEFLSSPKYDAANADSDTNECVQITTIKDYPVSYRVAIDAFEKCLM